MKVFKSLSYSLFLAMVLFSACSTDVETFNSDLLYGRWDIQSAQRDGRPTETLTNTFFEFDKAGTMVTNFSLEGNEVAGAFEIEGMKIIQKGNPDVSFSVEKLEEGKLILITKLMDYNFTLSLQKKN